MFRCIEILWDAVKVGFCQALVAQSVAPRPLLHHAARQLRHVSLALPADQFASLVYLKGFKNFLKFKNSAVARRIRKEGRLSL